LPKRTSLRDIIPFCANEEASAKMRADWAGVQYSFENRVRDSASSLQKVDTTGLVILHQDRVI
jgi:hypothetical protein